MFDVESTIPTAVAARRRERSILFKTRDGAELIGRLYLPARRPFAALILNGATGVPQGYYAHFARWLAEERGMACLTYDYRGVGRSSQGPLRRSRADMVDWGTTDAEAARACLAREFPGVQVWVMGHSLGAMMLPFQSGFDGVTRVIGVASGQVHHSDHPWPYQAVARMFWFGIGPLATAAMGYLPGRALGFGEDLPRGVYWQWRRWCTSRAFYDSEIGGRLPRPDAARIGVPVRLIGFADDQLIPPQCVERLAQRYDTPQVDVIDPGARGLRVGHLGAFARRNADLWPALLE